MAGVTARALSGNFGFPVRPFLVERAEGAAGFRDGSPGFVRSGKLRDDAAGWDRYLALVGGISLGHAETTGMLSRCRRVRGCLCLRVERRDAERGVHTEEHHGHHTNQPNHHTEAPVEGGMVTQPAFRGEPSPREYATPLLRSLPILSGHCSKTTVGVGECRSLVRRNLLPKQGQASGMRVARTCGHPGACGYVCNGTTGSRHDG